MFDFAFVEVVVPVLDQLWGQEVGLVDQQNILLFAFTHVLNVLLEVGCVKELWVSGIHDLNQHIGFFDDTP